MAEDGKNRIDRWLWAVRIYKTRSLAAEACKSGRVKLNDMPAKASKAIIAGDEITVRKGMIRHRFKVLGNLEKRVGAKFTSDYMLDITPQEELDKLQISKTLPTAFRPQGQGRPTKKDRRNIDRLKDEFGDIAG